MLVNLFYHERMKLNTHHCKQSASMSSQSLHLIDTLRIFLSLSLNHANNTSIPLVHSNPILFLRKKYFYPLLVITRDDLLAVVQMLYFMSLEQMRLRQFCCINISYRPFDYLMHHFLAYI